MDHLCVFLVSILAVCFYFFFFSSRRRHTRFSRDWSSDVCSSDLGVWIEMRRIFDSSVSASVAPFAGAWIEIMTDIYLLHTLLSLPSRERGLKYFKGTATAAYDSSLPSRRSEEHTSELQSRENLVCRLLLEKKKKNKKIKKK